MLGVVGSKLCWPTSLRPFERRARNCAVMRALASHQCGPGSNPSVDAIMWVEFAPRGFFSGYSAFPLSSKTNISNSNSTRNQVDEEPLCRCATSKSLFIYFIEVFIYLFNISWPSSFSGCQFVLFSVLRHSAVHSAIVFLPLVWLWSRREKCKNRSVFRVSAECE